MAVVGTDRASVRRGRRAPAAPRPRAGRRPARRRPRRPGADRGPQLVHHLQPGRAVQQQPGGHHPGPGRGHPGRRGAAEPRPRPGQAAAGAVLGLADPGAAGQPRASPTSPRSRCRRASASGCRSTCRSRSLAVVLAVLIGGTAGTVAAVRRGGWFDRAVTIVCSAVSTLPAFVIGIILVVLFAVAAHLLPANGYVGAVGQVSARGSSTSSCPPWPSACRSRPTSPGSCAPRWSRCWSRTTSPAPRSAACPTAGSCSGTRCATRPGRRWPSSATTSRSCWRARWPPRPCSRCRASASCCCRRRRTRDIPVVQGVLLVVATFVDRRQPGGQHAAQLALPDERRGERMSRRPRSGQRSVAAAAVRPDRPRHPARW